MDYLLKYSELKESRFGELRGSYTMSLSRLDNILIYESSFNFYYPRKYNVYPKNNINIDVNIIEQKSVITYNYKLEMDLDKCVYTTTNEFFNNDKRNNIKTKPEIKKNDFETINETINRGLIYGESRFNFWGAKHKRNVKTIFNKIEKIIKTRLKSTNHFNTKSSYNSLYTLLVDYYLDFHNIKGHDFVYHHIENYLPKDKWLSKNDRKFLPAVLDSHNIKSKYLVGAINSSQTIVNLVTLKLLCKILGNDYINYIKRISWQEICKKDVPISRKPIELKNKVEKNNLVLLLNDKNTDDDEPINLDNLSSLLAMRDKLEKKGLKLKFTAKNIEEFKKLQIEWIILQNHFKKGHKLKYIYPQEFIEKIEQPIMINNKKFNLKVLTTENEFMLEGVIMKNCMGNQFTNGLIMTFLCMYNNKKRINLSYQRGNLLQAYAKSNSTVSDDFKAPIEVLTERFKEFSNLIWHREKYDVIKSS